MFGLFDVPNLLLRWAGGITYYYQAYWLTNIRILDNIQRCSHEMWPVDEGWPGFDFWNMCNDQWWFYMACKGDEMSRRKTAEDSWDVIYKTYDKLPKAFIPGSYTVDLALALVILIAWFLVYLYQLIFRQTCPEWIWFILVLATNSVINNLTYAVLLIRTGPAFFLFNFVSSSLLKVCYFADKFIEFFPSFLWYGFQFGFPIFYLCHLHWIPLHTASIAIVRHWTKITDRLDIEETALIWSWRTIAKFIVRVSTRVAPSLASCWHWAYINTPWTLKKRVNDLTQREVNITKQVKDLRRQLETARIHRARNTLALRMSQFLVRRCINEHQAYHDTDEMMRRIRELEEQRDHMQTVHDELLAKCTAMRQASSAVALAGGPVKTVERLLQAAVHARDLHRSQIRNLIASLEGSDTQVAILKNKVKNLKKDLETANNGSAAILWREKEKEYLELKKRTDEEILERDLKIKRLRDSRDDNPTTSLSLDIRGQQTLRRQREELITAENELAHSQMLIEALMNKEAKFDEEKERIKKEAIHGTSERLQELYTNSTIQVEELSEKLKRLEHLERSENDLEAFQRKCKEEKKSLQQDIADKTQQISTYEALIDHAMASMEWDDNRFHPLDKYYGYISGAKAEIRRLKAEILQLEILRLPPRRRIERLDELSLEKDRLLDEREVLRKTHDDLQDINIQHEKNLIRLREQLTKRNTQITNLQAQNTELRAELRDGRAVVPLARRLNIAGIAAPVIEILIRNLLALEREIRKRGREVDELPAPPGMDGVPKIEREPGDISILRIVLWIGDRFDYLSTLIEESEPPWLGTADDWFDDDTDSPENMDARKLNGILRMRELWEYIGTLNYETILFVLDLCQRVGIKPGVEPPEPPRPPSPPTSPNLSPPRRSPPPPRSLNLPPLIHLFQAAFTPYKDFDMKHWALIPLTRGWNDSALSAANALLQSVCAQLPGHPASVFGHEDILFHMRNVTGRQTQMMTDPINERDVSETLYRIDHSLFLETVVRRLRPDGVTYAYHSREIVYPNHLEVPPPKRRVVLFVSENLWQGMRWQPGDDEQPDSLGASEDGSEHARDREPPVFDMTDWKVDRHSISEWTIPGIPADVVPRRNMSLVCAVARSYHWQHPDMMPVDKKNAQQAYECFFEIFNRKYSQHEGNDLPLLIQAVLEDILVVRGHRPHYRPVIITKHQINEASVHHATMIGDSESNSPILYIYCDGEGEFRGMRRRRENDPDDVFEILAWNDGETDGRELYNREMEFPRVPLSRIENYEMNLTLAPFNMTDWKLIFEWDHLEEGLQRDDERWIHTCAPRALHDSVINQYGGDLGLDQMFLAFRDVFPNHYNSWRDEEVARMVSYPFLIGLTLGVVHGNVYDNNIVTINYWDQPENYDPSVNMIVYVTQLTDLRPGGFRDNKYHWAGMRYNGPRPIQNPPVYTPSGIPVLPPPESNFRHLLDEATGLQGARNDTAAPGGLLDWSDFQTTGTLGPRWEAPPPPPSVLLPASLPADETPGTHRDGERGEEGGERAGEGGGGGRGEGRREGRGAGRGAGRGEGRGAGRGRGEGRGAGRRAGQEGAGGGGNHQYQHDLAEEEL